MKLLLSVGVVCVAICAASSVLAQPPGVPKQPGGVLKEQLGEYLTIEGTLVQGGKVETGTILVDTVNGKPDGEARRGPGP